MLLVAISGPSSSGKTTVANALHGLIKSSTLIHLDDFYFPDDQIPIDPVKKVANWDCPAAVDFARFEKYIKKIKSNGEVEHPPTYEGDVDLKLSEDELSKFKKIIEANSADIENEHIVFVEGFMLFHDPNIIKLFDVKLFFYASFETLKERRESRQGYNTVAGFWVDPPNYFVDMVWPEFVENHKYLFEDEDVTKSLSTASKDDLKLLAFKNENGTTLDEMVEWSLDKILPPSK